jgi:hypothetical protein
VHIRLSRLFRKALMMRIRRMVIGFLVSAALAAGAALAVVAATSSSPTTGTGAATAIEYGLNA